MGCHCFDKTCRYTGGWPDITNPLESSYLPVTLAAKKVSHPTFSHSPLPLQVKAIGHQTTHIQTMGYSNIIYF